jgi:hypothetical protein
VDASVIHHERREQFAFVDGVSDLLARTLVCTGVRTLRSSWARARSRASALST